MKSAVEEAVSRWPEFSNAFLRREDEGDDRFIVKAQFSEADRSEFMWVKVTAIEPKTIAGILMNDPHELQTYHRGMAVEIPMDRLNDWMFPGEDGEPVGGFTLGVLSGEEDEPGDRFDETTDR